MKSAFIIFVFISLLLISCTGKGKKPAADNTKKSTPVDSLLNYIDEGHMEGMGKIGRLHNTRKAVQAAIDSIGKLSANVKQSVADYVDNLTATIREIDYADMAMDKWMMEYRDDSAIDNEAARIKYLSGEKDKIEMVKNAIRSSLQKADSLLKIKF